MNSYAVPFLAIGAVGFAIQLGWYAVVLVLLVRIWRKVKHLPG
jgi:hypothetical protein